jgi:hypothetical protein
MIKCEMGNEQNMPNCPYCDTKINLGNYLKNQLGQMEELNEGKLPVVVMRRLPQFGLGIDVELYQ